MNIAQYKAAKELRRLQEWQPRATCDSCKKPIATCYCSLIRPFSSDPQFVILIHHSEVKRTIATGRMSHLCLKNSYFFEGTDFTHDEKVNALLADPRFHPVVLYPSPTAVNLSTLTLEQRRGQFPADKQLLVFVIDGTWSQAKRVRRLSQNISQLPYICFTPPRPSGFRVRQQPAEHCFSTIESIHHLIELMGGGGDDAHASMLRTFDRMVEQQVEYGHLRSFRHKVIK